MDSSITLTMQSRTTEGFDIGALIRESYPEADVQAVFDDDGAVSHYRLTVHFEDADAATDALFRIRDEFEQMGLAYRIEDPD